MRDMLSSKSLVLDLFKTKIQFHKYLFIREEKEMPAKDSNGLLTDELVAEFARLDFRGMNAEAFRALICSDKHRSVRFQTYVQFCPTETLNHVSDRVIADLEYLMKHEFGNYLVQRLVKRDALLSKTVEDCCRTNFVDLASNEYSSRVMQTMLAQSDAFRLFALDSLRSNMRLCFSQMSVVFLLSMSIGIAKSDAEISFVRDYIISDIQNTFSSKFFKRVGISFLEKASQADLDLVFTRLNMSANLERFLADKYYTYIVLVFLKALHGPALEALTLFIKTNLVSAVKAKYFKFMMLSLVKECLPAAVSLVNNALLHVPTAQLRRLLEEDIHYLYFYCYLTVLTTPERNSDRQIAFLQAIDDEFGIVDNLRKF